MIVLRILKKNQQKRNFHYAAMSLMMSQNLRSVDFTKTQKSRHLNNEILIFLLIKKFINYTSWAILRQKNNFVAKAKFKFKLLTSRSHIPVD